MPIPRFIAISIISGSTLLAVACSKPEQPTDAAVATSNTGYISENEQFVEQLNNEVKLDDPDALLAELNQPEKTSQ